MNSTPGNARVFYGWIVVGAAFTVLFFAYGLQFCYGVFATGMVEELGWDRATTALPYSIYVFTYSALSAATGSATDRYGPRQVITLGALLLGVGWGGSAFITSPAQLVFTLGIVAALGMSVAWVPCNATVARWFTRRRGSAVAVASSGASLGNFLVPPLAALLMASWGWRDALLVLALTSALIIFVAARYMVRDPESLSLFPDGEPNVPQAANPVGDGLSVREVRFTAPFQLLIGMYLFTWLVIFVPFVHLPAYAADLGFGATAGASLLSAIGIGGVAGRLSAGVVSDRIGRMPALYATFALQVIAFTAFAYSTTLGLLWFGAIAFGLSYGAGVALLPALCGDLFGRAHVASVVGAIFAVAGAPAAVGPYAAGWMYDAGDGYTSAFLSSAGLNVVALGLAVALGVHQKRTGDR